MKIQTGKGSITISTLLAIYSISMISSLPGLAISPILGDLEHIFNNASELKIQLLESLPSFIIVPFIILSGHLSSRTDKRQLLIIGLGIFFLCSIAYLFADNIDYLLIISTLLGIGAGIIVPFSTGLIADYFVEKYRARQLGLSSAINNFTLVIATFLAGFLAHIEWHYSFLVYCFSGISLAAIFFLRDIPKNTATTENTQKNKFHFPYQLMGLYFIGTFIALIIPFNLSILLPYIGISNSAIAGTMISIFFLAIMLPGINIPKIHALVHGRILSFAFSFIASGLILLILAQDIALISIGCIFCGLGYGILQPVIYERTVQQSDKHFTTYALSWVMVMNYVAIVIYPFIMNIFPTKDILAPFICVTILAIIIACWFWYKEQKE